MGNPHSPATAAVVCVDVKMSIEEELAQESGTVFQAPPAARTDASVPLPAPSIPVFQEGAA